MTNTAQNPSIVSVDPTSSTLIEVFEGEIGGIKQPVVDARQLHTYLKNQRQFSDWIKTRIKRYEFVESQDYSMVSQKCETIRNYQSGSRSGAKTSIEYHLTLDTAKELSMVENNEQGRTARRYFIDCERRATEALIQSLTSYTPRHKITPEQKSVLKEIVDQRVSGNVSARAEMWSRHNRHFNINSYHELLAVHFEDAKRYLANMDVKSIIHPQPQPHVQTAPVIDQELLRRFVVNMHFLRSWWAHYHAGIKGMNPHAAASVHEHFISGSVDATTIARHAGIHIPHNYINYYPWNADNYERLRYWQLHGQSNQS
ncbi:MAG: antA/AntB antirepressor family protein [Pseudomonadota bacterium]|nr:antA/AntB antirepressor family protein [Pseudomonadota bacterium]